MSLPERNSALRKSRRFSSRETGFEIGCLSLEDLDAIMAIEESSFLTPWSRNLFMEEYYSDLSRVFVARPAASSEREIAGYLCAWFVEDEIHILNLACHPRFRRRKVATALLAHCLSCGFSSGVRWAYLEVRQSNAGAMSLYGKHGFRAVGLRKGYYTDTREDAIVMALEMKLPAP